MTREEFVTGLRDAADFIEAHPDLPVYGEDYGEVTLTVPVASGEEMGRIARLLGRADKDYSGSTAKVERRIGPVVLGAFGSREQVCKAKVVGTKEVEREQIVTPAVTEIVTETVDVVEWECEPLLEKAA